MKRILMAILLSAVLMFSLVSIALADDPDDPYQLGTSGSAVTADGTTGDIIEVDPGTIPCDNIADIEDISAGNYDGILVSGGLQFAERFVGQTLTYNGFFDVLSGSPTNPLTLQPGATGENVNVTFYNGSYRIDGAGPGGIAGFGALAVIFPSPQSQVKFDIVGTDGYTANINFFRVDGTTVGTAVLTLPVDQTYGFEQTGGVREIAGFSIYNDDSLGYDNFCYADPEEPVEPEIPVEVGGDVSSVNKAALLTPWIAIAAAILVISGVTLAVRRRINS